MTRKRQAERALPTSPVVRLFELFEEKTGKSPRTKLARVAGLNALLTAVIVGGIRWRIDDAAIVQQIFGWTRGQYRFRLDEHAYATAIESGNESASRSLEALFGREPWLWPLPSTTGRRSSPARGRVAVGTHIFLEGRWWKVTSVSQERIVACIYGRSEKNTPTNRRTISRDQLVDLIETGTTEPGGLRQPTSQETP